MRRRIASAVARPLRRTFRPFIFIRVRPYSSRYGGNRGTPLDRVYIERFLAQHADAIHGEVLEVNDDGYTKRFGTSYRANVVDIRATTNARRSPPTCANPARSPATASTA